MTGRPTLTPSAGRPAAIDATIERAEAPLRWRAVTGTIQLPGGRHAVVQIPADATADELLALVASLPGLAVEARIRAGSPRLVVPMVRA